MKERSFPGNKTKKKKKKKKKWDYARHFCTIQDYNNVLPAVDGTPLY
jgi:hypothetical protein